MSRYVNRINTPVPPQSLLEPLAQYLTQEGFTQVNYKGNICWKKGTGLLVAPQYISFYFGEDFLQLEAFIKFALLPGVYIGEMGIAGFFGAVPKALLKDRVTMIEQYIYRLWQQMQPAAQPAVQQVPQQPVPPAP